MALRLSSLLMGFRGLIIDPGSDELIDLTVPNELQKSRSLTPMLP
jgi:hypothetical protein